MNVEWEIINGDLVAGMTRRMKVWGGWLVKNDKTHNLIFIEDKDGYWGADMRKVNEDYLKKITGERFNSSTKGFTSI